MDFANAFNRVVLSIESAFVNPTLDFYVCLGLELEVTLFGVVFCEIIIERPLDIDWMGVVPFD